MRVVVVDVIVMNDDFLDVMVMFLLNDDNFVVIVVVIVGQRHLNASQKQNPEQHEQHFFHDPTFLNLITTGNTLPLDEIKSRLRCPMEGVKTSLFCLNVWFRTLIELMRQDVSEGGGSKTFKNAVF